MIEYEERERNVSRLTALALSMMTNGLLLGQILLELFVRNYCSETPEAFAPLPLLIGMLALGLLFSAIAYGKLRGVLGGR